MVAPRRLVIFPHMARQNRVHAPGCVIHITARTQGQQPWFHEQLRTRVATEISAAAQSAGHLLLAHCIMPNHFHILIRQGANPLCFMMHRVMHRSAALLRRTHAMQGHVYERRYWSGVCGRAEYVRESIVYIHLNAWRAGLCPDPAEYEWSSHGYYLIPGRNSTLPVAAFEGRRLFQSTDEASALTNYRRYVAFRMAVDRLLAGELPASQIVPPDPCVAGDDYWLTDYAPAAACYVPARGPRPIFDVARTLLARIDPKCHLDLVRSGTRNPAIVSIRRQLMGGLLAHGYRGVAIARFLGVSQTCVSKLAVSLRS